jgi:multisubunit Na+/H+ antiporter MnhE subunit
MSGTAVLRRLLTFAIAWAISGAFYLLLIDTPSLPELLVGAGAAILAAGGFVLAVEQHVLGANFNPRWLHRAWRPVAQAPSDIVTVSLTALTQLVRPRATRGQFRSEPFRRGKNEEIEAGRLALVESLGSFAPNTIVVGVDVERELLLVHQLRKSDPVELLELG